MSHGNMTGMDENNDAAKTERTRLLPLIEQILDGIDRTEIDQPEGWWETSDGAAFGRRVLADIRELLGLSVRHLTCFDCGQVVAAGQEAERAQEHREGGEIWRCVDQQACEARMGPCYLCHVTRGRHSGPLVCSGFILDPAVQEVIDLAYPEWIPSA